MRISNHAINSRSRRVYKGERGGSIDMKDEHEHKEMGER